MAVIFGKKVRLRPKHVKDAANDYRWRRDEELSRRDAAIPLSISFGEYLLFYGEELYDTFGEEFRFAIETEDGRHIGNCALYNIDRSRKEAELGIMIGEPDCWDQGYGKDVTRTLVRHVFQETDLQRIYLKTLEWNGRAQKCFGTAGFDPCGSFVQGSHHFLRMEIYRSRWAGLQQGGDGGKDVPVNPGG